jgi:hypothetical protein
VSFANSVVLVLLLVSCLATAMACMVPSAEMSAKERACCRSFPHLILANNDISADDFSASVRTIPPSVRSFG